ncbi:MAG: hypothetical protein ACD_19C00432G0001, partial [uncultured bacterium]
MGLPIEFHVISRLGLGITTKYNWVSEPHEVG